MRQNMNEVDQGVRVVIAFALALVSLSLGFGTAIGILLLVASGVLLLTAATAFCPLYYVLRVSTRKRHVTGA